MSHPVVPDGMQPLAILGTTASGKSALAMAIARRHGDVDLVSVDSMQVYRGMDIGTAKPTARERAEVPHHGIDLVDPWEPYEVRSFQQMVASALHEIHERGRRAVLVGGTGLYLRAVVDGFDIPGRFPEVAAGIESEPDTLALHARLTELDPEAARKMEPTNRRRIVRALEVTLGSRRPFSSYGPGLEAHPPTPIRMVGLRLPTEANARRIEARFHAQMEAGFLDEVRTLAAGPPLSHTAAQALGYRELLHHVQAGEPDADLSKVVDEAIARTRGFARRQRAWFRKDPRITWLDTEDPAADLADLSATVDDVWRATHPHRT